MTFFWLAAAVLLALTILHLTLGQKEVVRPLLRSDVFTPDTTAVLFLCWHVVTLVMTAAMSAYVAAALSAGYRAFAVAATAVMGLLALWSLVVVVWKRQRHRDMPQWIAFSAVALLGLGGMLSS